MITGPKFKVCRRLGPGVFEKCQTPAFARSEAKPGRANKGRGGKGGMGKSDFGAQMLEKQKVRFTYRVSEKQFYNYVKKAVEKPGATQALYESLETRLDNVVFRLGFAHTRGLSRQLVSHGHILVNGRRVTIPSFRVTAGDIIGIREGSRTSTVFAPLAERYKEYTPPSWIRVDAEKKEGVIQQAPSFTADLQVNLQAVVEFYSR